MKERFPVSLDILEWDYTSEQAPKSHGGHMGYRSLFIQDKDGEKFIKTHDEQAFTDKHRAMHSKQYLVKEKVIYDHLASHAPHIIPRSVALIDDHTLVMEALRQEHGWHWRAPKNDVDRYADEVIRHLLSLQTIDTHDDPRDLISPSHTSHETEGWHTVDDSLLQKIILRIDEFKPHMKPYFKDSADSLIMHLPSLKDSHTRVHNDEICYFAHHDLRQSNIAWHPKHGTRIIDWSWAGPGRKNSDITTLLIDLHKSGHDVSSHMTHFNNNHALTMIGFWLAHSLWPSATKDSTVRLHQVISAVSAYDLLMKNR